MMNRLFVGITAAAVVFAPNAGVALAAPSIEVVNFELTECDPNTIEAAFQVSVPEEGANDVVEVKMDGTILFESDDVDDGDVLDFEDVAISSGDHVLSAVIYDNDDKDVVLASDEYDFNVECERSPQLYDDSNRHVNPNGSGDEGSNEGNGGGGDGDNGDSDDSSEQTVAKKAAVKGATTKAVSSSKSLKPLNSVFRSVYGRNPTAAEWKYWADRYLTDKPQWDALYGAMQWQKLRGRTIGA